jgi:hypothetical protein
MKTTGLGPERGPNALKRRPGYRIGAWCYVIIGLNEADFCRKSLAGNGLPFWWVPTINKFNARKDLGSILAGGPSPGGRNVFPRSDIRRPSISEKFSTSMTKFIGVLIFLVTRIVAATGPNGTRNGLKRPYKPLKRGYKRAKKWRSDPVFARKVIVSKGIGLWPPPAISIPSGDKELRPIMAGGSRPDCLNSLPNAEMRPTTSPEKIMAI